jgi:acetyltransferase-like isoleucine patch superfamily enzyme
MKAYVVQNDAKIEPFGNPARDCLILNQTLAGLQVRALAENGMEAILVPNASAISDTNEHLMVGENVFFTPELLAEFVWRSRLERGRITICALKNGLTTQRTAVSVQDVVAGSDFTQYNLCSVPETGRDGDLRSVIIDPDEFSASLAMPHHMCGAGEYKIPMTEKLVIQIDHWANLWVANIVAILAEGARLKRKSKAELLWLAAKARSFNKWKIMRSLNKIGRNCDIHPTAYIEGSIIGEGVSVGAGAVIRESVIGDGVFIGNGVAVEESVIGYRSTILNGHILYSVLYPGVFSVTVMISASMLGADTFIGSDAILTDFRFDGKNVTVMKNGSPVDSGNVFLGSCLGHRVRLGSGCIVAPGRAVPCGLQIVAGKDRTVWENFEEVPSDGPNIIRR